MGLSVGRVSGPTLYLYSLQPCQVVKMTVAHSDEETYRPVAPFYCMLLQPLLAPPASGEAATRLCRRPCCWGWLFLSLTRTGKRVRKRWLFLSLMRNWVSMRICWLFLRRSCRLRIDFLHLLILVVFLIRLHWLRDCCKQRICSAGDSLVYEILLQIRGTTVPLHALTSPHDVQL